jgi:hypothetical protein
MARRGDACWSGCGEGRGDAVFVVVGQKLYRKPLCVDIALAQLANTLESLKRGDDVGASRHRGDYSAVSSA